MALNLRRSLLSSQKIDAPAVAKVVSLFQSKFMVEDKKMIADPEILVCNHLLLVKKIFYNLKTEFLKHDKIFLDTPGAIKPLVGDVVLVWKETPSLGLVTEILSPRRVVVRHKHRGSNADHQYHCKILALIFRPESPVYFMSIFDKPQMPHLLEDFWTRLKQKLT